MNYTTILLALAATSLLPASATVLTFDTGLGNGVPMPQTYGDQVTSITSGAFSYGAAGGFTPNIAVEYTSPDTPTDLNFWTTGYSDLVNVLENEPDGENSFTVRFTADSGFLVRLDGFDLGNFGSQVTLTGFRVEDALGNSLFSVSNLVVPASTQPHLDFDFAGGLFASQINLIVDTTGLGGNSDNIGLDNIQFGQTAVPEPSAAALFLPAALCLLRRKRQRG
jgi:hypothetical protein